MVLYTTLSKCYETRIVYNMLRRSLLYENNYSGYRATEEANREYVSLRLIRFCTRALSLYHVETKLDGTCIVSRAIVCTRRIRRCAPAARREEFPNGCIRAGYPVTSATLLRGSPGHADTRVDAWRSVKALSFAQGTPAAFFPKKADRTAGE